MCKALCLVFLFFLCENLLLQKTYEFEGEIRIFNGAVILSDKLILYLGFVFMCTGKKGFILLYTEHMYVQKK